MNQKVTLTDEQALKKANAIHYDNQADQVDWIFKHKEAPQKKPATSKKQTASVPFEALSFHELEKLYIDIKDRLIAYRDLPVDQVPALQADVCALGRKAAAIRICMQKKASPEQRSLLSERKHLTKQLHLLSAENKKLYEENKRLKRKGAAL